MAKTDSELFQLTGFQDPSAFDPRGLMKTIKFKNGVAQYLSVKDRVQWKNAQHPDWAVRITLLAHDFEARTAVCQADVVVLIPIRDGTLQEYVISSDIGSESGSDFADYFEKASTKARGRALAACGYDTRDGLDFEIEESLEEQGRYPGVDTGVEVKDAPPPKKVVTPPQPKQEPSVPQGMIARDLDAKTGVNVLVWATKIKGFEYEDEQGRKLLDWNKFRDAAVAAGHSKESLTDLFGGVDRSSILKWIKSDKRTLQQVIDGAEG